MGNIRPRIEKRVRGVKKISNPVGLAAGNPRKHHRGEPASSKVLKQNSKMCIVLNTMTHCPYMSLLCLSQLNQHCVYIVTGIVESKMRVPDRKVQHASSSSSVVVHTELPLSQHVIAVHAELSMHASCAPTRV